MEITEQPLINLCNIGLEMSKRVAELTEQIDRITPLIAERNSLLAEKRKINAELQRRKCHDIGGALTLIQTNEIAADSTEIFDRERNKVKKV
jgi:hypothetical protein